MNESGLLEVIFGSSCRKDPEAAFLGLANTFSSFFFAISFILSKAFLEIKISPLITINDGISVFDDDSF